MLDGSAGASMRKHSEDPLVQYKPPTPQNLEATERKDGQWSVTCLRFATQHSGAQNRKGVEEKVKVTFFLLLSLT